MKKFVTVTEARLVTDSGIDERIGNVKPDEFDQISASEIARVIQAAGTTFCDGDKILISKREMEVG